MVPPEIARLESFLVERFGFQIPTGLEFKRIREEKLQAWLKKDETDEDRIVNLSMNDFLTKELVFNPAVKKLVSETIEREGLLLYAGLISYDGRGEAALATGGNIFNNLKALEEAGLITRFLSYQGDLKQPSPLCNFALREGIRVYAVDEVSVFDRADREVLGKKARGKTENILKLLLLLNQEIQDRNVDLNKIYVLFLDDDYTLLDDRAHYVLLAAWVLSFAKATLEENETLIERCRDVGFVKNGGVRVHFPPFLAHKILQGEVIKDYRSLILETLRLELDFGEAGSEENRSQVSSVSQKLNALPSDLVLTPENLELVVTGDELTLIRNVMRKFFYPGGRVTKPYTRKNVHEAENFLSYWLGRFTYILHGDQGATMRNWLSMRLGQGYAFDSSVIIQFLMDEDFAEQRIVDIQNTPHAHQPQEEPKVEGMEDLINLVTEALRVYYGNWSVDLFTSRYEKRTRVSWLPDGRYVRKRIWPQKGPLFYPETRQLHLGGDE